MQAATPGGSENRPVTEQFERGPVPCGIRDGLSLDQTSSGPKPCRSCRRQSPGALGQKRARRPRRSASSGRNSWRECPPRAGRSRYERSDSSTSGAQPFAVDMNSAAKIDLRSRPRHCNGVFVAGCPAPNLACVQRQGYRKPVDQRKERAAVAAREQLPGDPGRVERGCDHIRGPRLDHRGRIGTGEAAPGSRVEAGDANQRQTG